MEKQKKNVKKVDFYEKSGFTPIPGAVRKMMNFEHAQIPLSSFCIPVPAFFLIFYTFCGKMDREMQIKLRWNS